MSMTCCSNHEERSARWYCPACRLHFCQGCLDTEIPRCPRCNEPPDRIEPDAAKGPLSLPRHLAFPFRPRPLAVLIGAGVLGPASFISVAGPAIGLLLAVAILHFGFRVFEQAAWGEPPAPRATLRPDGQTLVRAVALLGALLAYAALGIGVLFYAGPGGVLLYGFGMAMILPATILVVGQERGLATALLKSLHPTRLAGIAHVLGQPYYGVGMFLFLVAASMGGLSVWLVDRAPLWGLMAGASFLGAFTLIFTFRAAGNLAAVHRRDLGFFRAPGIGAQTHPPARGQPSRRQRVAELVRENRLMDAAELLRAEVAEDPDDLNRWERLYGVLRAQDRDAPFLAGSRAFITTLVRAGREERALEVAQDALNRDPAFRPSHPGQIHSLALAARNAGRPRLALRLMNRFNRLYPDHPDVPAVMLLSARILHEDFQERDRAYNALEALIQRFPEHSAAAEARELITGLAKAS